MSENLRTYTQALYLMDAVVQRTPPGAWANASPCPDWCAAELVGHHLQTMERLTNDLTGAAPAPERSEADLAGDDASASWTTGRDALLEALDQDGALQRVVTTPFGEMEVDALLGFISVDVATHAWDLAQAVGVDHGIPASVGERNLGMVGASGELLRGAGMLGPIVEVADDAPVVDRWIAMMGRDPSA